MLCTVLWHNMYNTHVSLVFENENETISVKCFDYIAGKYYT